MLNLKKDKNHLCLCVDFYYVFCFFMYLFSPSRERKLELSDDQLQDSGAEQLCGFLQLPQRQLEMFRSDVSSAETPAFALDDVLIIFDMLNWTCLIVHLPPLRLRHRSLSPIRSEDQPVPSEGAGRVKSQERDGQNSSFISPTDGWWSQNWSVRRKAVGMEQSSVTSPPSVSVCHSCVRITLSAPTKFSTKTSGEASIRNLTRYIYQLNIEKSWNNLNHQR